MKRGRHRARDIRKKHRRRTASEPTGRRRFSGAKLRQLREAKGLSLEAVALPAGTTRTTIDRYERGEGEPDASVLFAIAECLGVKLDALYEKVA